MMPEPLLLCPLVLLSLQASHPLSATGAHRPQSWLLALRDPWGLRDLWVPMPDPQWQLADIFKLDPPAIRTLKIKLASHLNIRLGNCNQSKQFAEAIGNTKAYDPAEVKTQWDDVKAKASNGSNVPADHAASMTINGCQVAWVSSSALNVGYVLTSCKKYIDNWDINVERRAGGLIEERFSPHDEQELTLTNMSSMLCLFAHVAHAFKTTGAVPEPLARAFKSIRVTLYWAATSDDIRSLNYNENVEQRQRKAHSELDNVACVQQWKASMLALPGCDPEVGLNVVKYALCVTDLRSSSLPTWLSTLLKGKAATLKNKLEVVLPLTAKQIKELKNAQTPHPQLNSYSAVMLRLRFLKGFSADGISGLHELLFERMGLMGLADRPFPISGTILMSPDILTSAAFQTSAEKDKVPAWRDGALGEALQRRMPAVAAKRFFEHGGMTSSRPLFATAAAWPAFTRLIDHIELLFAQEFGPKDTWSDTITVRYKEIWRGDFDYEAVQFSVVGGAHLESNPHQMQTRIKSELPCVNRLLKALEEIREMTRSTVQAAVAPVEDTAPQEEQRAVEKQGDGVINSQVDGFGEMSASERKQLAAELTQKAKDERAQSMDQELSYMAASIFRARVMIVTSAMQAPETRQNKNQVRVGLSNLAE